MGKSSKKNESKKLLKISSFRIVFVSVICVLLFGLAVLSSVYYRYKFVNLQHKIETYELKNWSEGELVTDSRFVFSFNDAHTDSREIPHVWELGSGQQYLIINMTFKNTSGIVYQLSPISYMQILGNDGETYKVSSAPFIKNSLGGPVEPGQTVRGEVGFTIPTTLSSGDFVFDPGLVDAHQIRVHFDL